MSSHFQPSDEYNPAIPTILPHAKVFLIQVGYKLFRLSGASLLSDAPSYFTSYFSQEDNVDTVLFIDRDPVIFDKIYNHLQGYHVNVETDYEFMHLWLDCHYFCLKRFQHLLESEDLFASIGGVSFKVPKSLFLRTGNYPNFFLVNFDSLLILADNPRLIETKAMIRPPPQKPVSAPARSPLLFADLLELLRGNSTVIKDDEHRRLLVKECRYFRFLELEQRIIKHKLVYNPKMKKLEIMLNLTDLQSRGVVNVSTTANVETPLEYKRPNVSKEVQRTLLVQLESTPESRVRLVLNRATQLTTLILSNKLAHQYRAVFKKLAFDLNDESADELTLLAGLLQSKVVINGLELNPDWYADFYGVKPEEGEPPAKRAKTDEKGDYVEFQLTKSVWRILTRGDKSRVHAVHLEGLTDQEHYYKGVEFL